MNFIVEVQKEDIFIDIIRLYIITVFTYYLSSKLINKDNKNIFIYAIIFLVSIICLNIMYMSTFLNCIISIIIILSIIFSIKNKNNIGHSLLTVTISLSLNYIIFFIAICISFLPGYILEINNKYINFVIVIATYLILMYLFFKVKRIKKGLAFLQDKINNEYFGILILNISIVILFLVILLSNYKDILTNNIFWALVTFCAIMFITIQKSLQLYYKQKLIIQDLDETKKELEDKNKEIKELEKENLKLSKINHSVAHKQKSLEYKLNQLILKNEIAEELDIKDKMNNISRELDNQKTVELTKTNISEIDDMLKYMQSECIKNNIDFELQISGNINHMINKVIPKENLEILIADHIKNSIIAIKHSKNSNKSILVRIGLIDGIYSIYVYDSGIEFEIKTLKNLGIKPSSTHLNDGGSGMGFMNTFDTLNKFNASIIINEYGKESKDNYTKYIAIKFDSKHEFKIYSYRADKIKEKNNNKNIIIESQDLKW